MARSALGVSVKADVRGATRFLRGVQRQQIPFATSVALNRTAFDARDALIVGAQVDLDAPTPFTLRGFQVRKATKRSLTATVFIEQKRAKYLALQVFGGTRRVQGRALLEPTQHLPRNRYGNVPGWRRKRGQLLARKRTFEATIRGTTGIWERRGKGRVRLLMAYSTEAQQYRPRFDVFGHVRRAVDRVFSGHFDQALARALATAR